MHVVCPQLSAGEADESCLDVLAAGLLHGELEVDVLGHADLLVEQRGLALVAQLLPPAVMQKVKVNV